MIRVLWVPRIHTTAKVTGCSGFNAQRWVFESLGRRGLTRTICWLPSNVDLSGIDTSLGIDYMLKGREWKKTGTDLIESDYKLDNAIRAKKFEIDIIVTDYLFNSVYKRILQYDSPYALGIPAQAPVLTWFNETLEKPQLVYFREPFARTQVLLSSMAGKLGFINNYAKRQCLAEARRVFKPTMISDLMDSPLLDSPIGNIKDFDSIYEANLTRLKTTKESVIIDAGSMGRKHEVLLASIEKTSTGSNVKCVFLTQGKGFVGNNLYKDDYDLNEFADRSLVLEKLKIGNIGWFTNLEAKCGTALFFWESILAGVMPIIYGKKSWIDEIIPAELMIRAFNENELNVKTLWLIKNRANEKLIEQQAKLRDFVLEMKDQDRVADTWFDAINCTLFESYDPNMYKGSYAGEIVLGALDKIRGRALTTEELGEALRESSKSGTVELHKSINKIAFRRVMRSCGLRDVGKDKSIWSIK